MMMGSDNTETRPGQYGPHSDRLEISERGAPRPLAMGSDLPTTGNGVRVVSAIQDWPIPEDAQVRAPSELLKPAAATTIDFNVLGPLTVRRDGRVVTLGRGKILQLLAVLLCRAGQPVATDELIEALWTDRQPDTVRKSLQVYVHRLRRQVGDPRIRYSEGGYSIGVPPDELDAWQFADLAARGRVMHTKARLSEARELLLQALTLWRGAPYADVTACPIVAEEVRRLNEQRLVTLEERIAVDLDLGHHTQLISELSVLARTHPYREGLQGQLMLALYRAGRQAEALETFRGTRRLLVEELGVEPGSALQNLHRQVLAGDPAIDTPPASDAARLIASAIPAQLPGDVAGIVGRTAELARMDHLLTTHASVSATATPVLALVGTAGVGKTTLALHWAHRVIDLYPDGQLYIDLRGYASDPPVRMIDALGYFLRALGIPASAIPVEVAEAAALFRSVVAGQRVLVVLDNARSVEHVRPLLPGSPGSAALITSRDRLDGLVAREGAHRLSLDVLAPGECRGLLADLLGDDRIRSSPAEATELARQCAHLPLALRIVAAALINHPHRTLADQVAILRRGNRLAALALDGDPDAAVLVAFDTSYQMMSPPARRLFRQLGLAPTPDLSVPAAAALGDIGHKRAAQLLDQLCAAHLLHEVGVGRFGFHDLLRQYAKEKARADDGHQQCRAALQRLFDWYVQLVHSAAAVLYPDGPRLLPGAGIASSPARIGGGPRQAIQVLDAERRNLVAVIRYASRHGPKPTAWLLADGLRYYLDRRRHVIDLFAVGCTSLAAARAEEDQRGQVIALQCLADAYHCVGRYPQAIGHLRDITVLAREAGWDDVQARAHGNLGVAFIQLGQPQKALQHLRRALDINNASSRGAQASFANNVAMAHCEAGRLEEGLRQATEALAGFTELNSPSGQGTALDTLAGLELQLGRLRDAGEHASRALAMASDTGARLSRANVLITQARIHRDAGHHQRAMDCARTAISRAREIGEQRAEAYALNVLASVHDLLGHFHEAIELHHAALAKAECPAKDSPLRYVMAEAFVGLARANLHLGDHDTALRCANRAREIARHNQLCILEGQAIEVLADLCLATDQVEIAADHARRAVANHRCTGHRLGEARALITLGEALRRIDGNCCAATSRWQAASDLYIETGARPPERLLSLLEDSKSSPDNASDVATERRAAVPRASAEQWSAAC